MRPPETPRSLATLGVVSAAGIPASRPSPCRPERFFLYERLFKEGGLSRIFSFWPYLVVRVPPYNTENPSLNATVKACVLTTLNSQFVERIQSFVFLCKSSCGFTIRKFRVVNWAENSCVKSLFHCIFSYMLYSLK